MQLRFTHQVSLNRRTFYTLGRALHSFSQMTEKYKKRIEMTIQSNEKESIWSPFDQRENRMRFKR